MAGAINIEASSLAEALALAENYAVVSEDGTQRIAITGWHHTHIHGSAIDDSLTVDLEGVRISYEAECNAAIAEREEESKRLSSQLDGNKERA